MGCYLRCSETRTCCSASNSSTHLPAPSATECKRHVGDVDRHPGLVPEPLVEPTEQGAAPGEHDAAVHDVARQLRRRLVEGRTDRVDDRVQRLLERLPDLGRRDDDVARQPAHHVAATDLGLGLVRAAGTPTRAPP